MRIFLCIGLLCLLAACKRQTTPEQKLVDSAEAQYEKQPSDSTAQALVQAIDHYVVSKGYSDEATPEYLLRAARVSSDHKNLEQSLEYHRTYLTQYPDSPVRADRLAEVITITEQLNQPELNQILYTSFVSRYPKDSRAATFDKKIENKAISVDSIISSVFHTMFDESIFRLNEQRSRLYIQACETAIMADPALPNAPEHLLRAAETARTLRDFHKAIRLHDWIIEKYPEHHRASTALFLKAFIYDNDLKDLETARKYYMEYLEKYPAQEYAESAKYLLENLGKSEEDLLKMIEQSGKDVQ